MTDATTRPENILEILQRIYPGIDLEPLVRMTGGRQWYIPSPRKRDMAEVKDQIRRDPCRDRRVVSRRYEVSVALVYEIWNEREQLKRV